MAQRRHVDTLWVAAGLVLVLGAALAAHLLLGNRPPDPPQLARLKTACRQCHAKPTFASARAVHALHPQVDCDTCHPSSPPVVDFAACASCHGTPRYGNAARMHDVHAALGCSRCHSDSGGLKTADKLHAGLRWFGLGMALLGLVVIASNAILANRKTRAA
jgi:hypothetical protein